MKLAAVLAVLLSVGVAHAQSGPMDPYDDAGPRVEHKRQRARVLRQALVQQFDQDGDGRLAPEERQHAARALHRLAKRLQSGGHKGMKGPKGGKGQGKANRRERLIRRFDLNGDGNLTPDEIPPRVRERLRRLDRNGDDYVGPREMR